MIDKVNLAKTNLTFDDVYIRPKYSDIASRTECDVASNFTKRRRVKTPLIAAPMDTVCESVMMAEMWRLGGVGILHRFGSIDWQVEEASMACFAINMIRESPPTDANMFADVDTEPIICAAIGATRDFLERAKALVTRGNVNVLLIDVAHGHHKNVKDAIYILKNELPDTEFILGNIATAEAASDLISWGADALRVGIGGGSVCTTRINTGIGVPQLSSVEEVAVIADQFDVPVIADGGVRVPGDVAKAIAAGASTVMIGSLLSGTKETPGAIHKSGKWPNETLHKRYAGSASIESKSKRGESKNVEGTSRAVVYKGKTKRIVGDILDGLRSSMSYVGARSINEFQSYAEFVKVTSAGQIEATPHALIL